MVSLLNEGESEWEERKELKKNELSRYTSIVVILRNRDHNWHVLIISHQPSALDDCVALWIVVNVLMVLAFKGRSAPDDDDDDDDAPAVCATTAAGKTSVRRSLLRSLHQH